MTDSPLPVDASLAPDADETPPCPVCDGTDEGAVVGERGRFNLPVRNIVCPTCALVYQSPRPTEEAMAEYYAGAYRQHYGDVQYPFKGGAVGPDDPGFQEALDDWHGNQATNAIALGELKPGAKVLEIGCRHGRTLEIMWERLGIEMHGVEPGPDEARAASQAGVDCFCGPVEAYDPGDGRFDQIQLFHVLEHLHHPLDALLRFRRWLKPRGRLIIEVPNVYKPYGLLEENFFQNAHLTNFSSFTLTALLGRAGMTTHRVLDMQVLFAVAEVDTSIDASALPLPYDADRAAAPFADPDVIEGALKHYAQLEKCKYMLLGGGVCMEALALATQLLKQPGFAFHKGVVLEELVEFFLAQSAPRAALVLVGAALESAQDAPLREFLQEIANKISAAIAAA